MKGIFSGLEKLGLGKLEKVEVFEDASKKEEEAKKGKRKPAAEQINQSHANDYSGQIP